MSKTNTTRKEANAYHHGNLREAAIETALAMVKEVGIDAITLRGLSEHLGTSRTAIYRHFENKEALMQAVVAAGFERFEAVIRPVFLRADADVLARFRQMGEAYLTFAVRNPELYRLLFGESLRQEREAVCDLEDAERSGGFSSLVGLIEEGQAAGLFKTGDAFLQAATVWAMIHGFSLLIIDGHLLISDKVDPLFEAGIDTLLNGLRAKPA